jgi:hypothetical protein
MVVADKISAFKNTGIVLKVLLLSFESRPNVTDFPRFKSKETNFEEKGRIKCSQRNLGNHYDY